MKEVNWSELSDEERQTLTDEFNQMFDKLMASLKAYTSTRKCTTPLCCNRLPVNAKATVCPPCTLMYTGGTDLSMLPQYAPTMECNWLITMHLCNIDDRYWRN